MATSLKLNNELKNRVQHIADVQHRSSHWVMCEAIRKYVEIEEARDSFKQEALASWVEYRETGQHLTGKEVQDWLDTWGTDDDRKVPQCHK